jgi:ERCC4-type nuclease
MRRPLKVDWEWTTLQTGDYSIKGLESRVCIERKSLADLYNSCGQGRERFEREHQRLAEMEFAAVVIEADFRMMLHSPPEHSKLKPKCVYRTMLSWMIRYGVHWLPAGGYTPKRSRRLAEITTFRLLEKFWNEQQRHRE